jgi:hypothetical protein
MITLHIENTVRDFDTWKAAFDKFDRFRGDQGVRAYRVARRVDDGNQVTVDLDFDTTEAAVGFKAALERIWATPQSRQELESHSAPVVYEVAEERILSAAAASGA